MKEKKSRRKSRPKKEEVRPVDQKSASQTGRSSQSIEDVPALRHIFDADPGDPVWRRLRRW